MIGIMNNYILYGGVGSLATSEKCSYAWVNSAVLLNAGSYGTIRRTLRGGNNGNILYNNDGVVTAISLRLVNEPLGTRRG